MKILRLRGITYKRHRNVWDDELVDRLHLLMASQEVSHDNHVGETAAIFKEVETAVIIE